MKKKVVAVICMCILLAACNKEKPQNHKYMQSDETQRKYFEEYPTTISDETQWKYFEEYPIPMPDSVFLGILLYKHEDDTYFYNLGTEQDIATVSINIYLSALSRQDGIEVNETEEHPGAAFLLSNSGENFGAIGVCKDGDNYIMVIDFW